LSGGAIRIAGRRQGKFLEVHNSRRMQRLPGARRGGAARHRTDESAGGLLRGPREGGEGQSEGRQLAPALPSSTRGRMPRGPRRSPRRVGNDAKARPWMHRVTATPSPLRPCGRRHRETYQRAHLERLWRMRPRCRSNEFDPLEDTFGCVRRRPHARARPPRRLARPAWHRACFVRIGSTEQERDAE
jgi:hypothetical protein